MKHSNTLQNALFGIILPTFLTTLDADKMQPPRNLKTVITRNSISGGLH